MTTEQVRHTKKSSKGFLTYIHRVLKQVDKQARITHAAINQINSAISVVATALSDAAIDAAVLQKKKTVSSREVQQMVRIHLPTENAKRAVSEGTKAVIKYNSGDGAGRRELSAGLVFSVSLCEKYLRRHGASSLRVGQGAPIYLAAVLEYITAELLISCERERNGVITINTRHVYLGIVTDAGLNAIFKKYNIVFSGGGVLPYIHPELIKEHKPLKTKKNEDGVKKPHRFRPGTVALREIRRYQKSGECMIQHLPFDRLVRETTKEFSYVKLRFSEDVIEHLQSFVESCLVNIYTDAQTLAIHAKREGVNNFDLELVWKLSSLPQHSSKREEIISNAPLQRLARRGGIKRVNNLAEFYDVSRAIINTILNSILNAAANYTELLSSKTITKKILVRSIRDIGFNFVVG